MLWAGLVVKVPRAESEGGGAVGGVEVGEVLWLGRRREVLWAGPQPGLCHSPAGVR